METARGTRASETSPPRAVGAILCGVRLGVGSIGRRPRSGRCAILSGVVALAVLGSTAWSEPVADPASPATPVTDEIQVRIGRDTLAGLLEAAVPYDVTIKAGLFEQVLSLTEPRDLQLDAEGISLRMTVTGRPLPLSAVVRPRLRVVPDPATGGHVVKIDKLPIEVGRLGTYDLAALMRPVPIEKLSHHLIEIPGRTIGLDLMVRGIEIRADGLFVRFGADFS